MEAWVITPVGVRAWAEDPRTTLEVLDAKIMEWAEHPPDEIYLTLVSVRKERFGDA